MVSNTCLACGKTFETYPSQTRKYCTAGCRSSRPRKYPPRALARVSNTCLACGEVFETYPSQARDYCGKNCAYSARRKDEISTRYRMIHAPGHPLAQGVSPYIPEHRAILWAKIGPGSHPCYHCGRTVRWWPGRHVRNGALVCDHLDRNSRNNDPANLAPSCHPCNSRNQAAAVADDEPHRVRVDGSRLRGEVRTCATCKASFVAWPDPRPGKGLYCSRPCARRRGVPESS